MTLESPEDLMRQIVAWMAIMFVAAIFSAYMLYHSKREAKRLLTTKEAWGTDKLSADDPAAVARIRRRLIIFYAVGLMISLGTVLVGLVTWSRLTAEQKSEAVVVTEETSPGGHGAEVTGPATPGGVEQAARPSKSAEASPKAEAPVQPSKQSPPRHQARMGQGEAPMVLVPGGTFWMGISDDEAGRAIEDCKVEFKKHATSCKGLVLSAQPRHQVTLDPFSLDPYEVTNRQFEQFVQATGYRTTAEKEGTASVWNGQGWPETKGATWRQPEAGPEVFASDRADHPVVNVSWHDAEAYCRWAGKRLPTEAEFEYATRAGTQTTHWWGNFSPGTRQVANVADESAKSRHPVIMMGYDDGAVTTAPVGSYEANPFGLFDMTACITTRARSATRPARQVGTIG